jgi:hypothetical protein
MTKIYKSLSPLVQRTFLSVQRPYRKRIRLRHEQNTKQHVVAAGAVLPQSDAVDAPHVVMGPSASAQVARRVVCSGARFSELKRAFGDDASNVHWWDRRAGPGLEYLSGRSIEMFPLLRPLPEVPLAEPSGDIAERLMRLFEPELVKRMANGITWNVAACVDAEHDGRGSTNASPAYLCGHIDNFCQKFVRCLVL